MNSNKWKNSATWAWIAVAILVIIAIIAFLSSSSSSAPKKVKASDEKTPSVCWKVVRDGNDAGDRVVKAGLSGSAAKVSSELLAAAQHDPSALVALYNMSPLAKSGQLSESEVASNGCYTSLGQKSWYALAKEMNTAKKSNKVAPSNGCNTFVKNGKVTVKCETILGNREATKIVWGDGSVTYILHRCGNPMVPHKPVPHKPTPTTPVPTTPTPTHPAPCVKPNKPGSGVYTYNPSNCTWHKPPQSFDDMQNKSPAHQPVQNNDTSGVYTGPTKGKGTGTSSPSNGGTGTAPSGGGSDGSGGTKPDNPPVNTGQGGTNDSSGNGGIVNPG